jgi:carboxypeptidase T
MASSSRHRSPFFSTAAAALALALAMGVVGAQEDSSQRTAIDGHDCLRDLDSTIRSMFDLAALHPELASVADVGDSYIRSSGVPNDDYDGLPSDGYAIYAMNVTAPWSSSSSFSSSWSGKGRMMITTGVHAREYAPPELALRFVEYLLGNYGTDPDVTWLLRHTEVHFILQVNPDGRYVAENYPETSQRKNMNEGDGGCIGVDINRNFDFMWGDLGGSSDDPCSSTYHGTGPESESETLAVARYARGLFPTGQRKADPTTSSGEDIMGVFVDIHSSGGLVYFPWGYADERSPDDEALQALGRKVAYNPGYKLWGPGSPDFGYPASGDSSDYMYGVLGVASFGLEIGEDFYEDCDLFEGTIVPSLLPSLLYAAKIAKKPFSLVKGPDIIDLVVSSTDDSNAMKIAVVASDSHMANGHSTGEQGVAYVRLYLDVQPDDYEDGNLTFDMVPSSEDAQTFDLELILPLGLASGQHALFVQATDGDGYVGPVSSEFFDVKTTDTTSPTDAPAASSSSPPTNQPAGYPTLVPSEAPITDDPTTSPSSTPTPSPSRDPSKSPSDQPTTGDPSFEPTTSPVIDPSGAPSAQTPISPSVAPTTSVPTLRPAYALSLQPTNNSTLQPTKNTLDQSDSIDTSANIPQVNTSINSAAGPVACSSIIIAASLVVVLIV